jgi:hypothetical protein
MWAVITVGRSLVAFCVRSQTIGRSKVVQLKIACGRLAVSKKSRHFHYHESKVHAVLIQYNWTQLNVLLHHMVMMMMMIIYIKIIIIIFIIIIRWLSFWIYEQFMTLPPVQAITVLSSGYTRTGSGCSTVRRLCSYTSLFRMHAMTYPPLHVRCLCPYSSVHGYKNWQFHDYRGPPY